MHHKIRKTNQQLHLFQSLAQLFNLVLGCLESGLQLETNKKNKWFVKQFGHFTPVLCILSVSASAQLVSQDKAKHPEHLNKDLWQPFTWCVSGKKGGLY